MVVCYDVSVVGQEDTASRTCGDALPEESSVCNDFGADLDDRGLQSVYNICEIRCLGNDRCCFRCDGFIDYRSCRSRGEIFVVCPGSGKAAYERQQDAEQGYPYSTSALLSLFGSSLFGEVL